MDTLDKYLIERTGLDFRDSVYMLLSNTVSSMSAVPSDKGMLDILKVLKKDIDTIMKFHKKRI